MSPPLASTIVRYHRDIDALSVLDQAIASLAAQDYPSCQVILVLQNCTEHVRNQAGRILTRHFPARSIGTDTPEVCSIGPHKIVSVTVPENVDARARLLNAGLAVADGRYIGFLDYDDVLYPNAYSLLIATLEKSGKGLAVGGVNYALMRSVDGKFEPYKTFPFLTRQRSMADFCYKNFIPINSYLIDRTRVRPELLQFDERFNRAEDYVFLLRLAEESEFDLSNQLTPVAEYRMRDDCSNTHPHPWLEAGPSEKSAEWDRQVAMIHDMKSSMYVRINVLELSNLIAEIAFARELQRRFRLVRGLLHTLRWANRTFQISAAFFARIFK